MPLSLVTTGLLAPLVLAAILAFPWLGPLLHLLLLVGAGPVWPTAGGGRRASWGVAAGCVAVAGVGLAVAVEIVRRLVATILAIGVPEPIT